MRKMLLSAIVIFACIVFSIAAAAEEQRGINISSERLALVIGNSDYQTAPLRNPVNDAEDMGRVLTGLGFRVILQRNVDRRAMEEAIRGFGRQLRSGGVGLFYFAGHGIQVEGLNYLIPVDVRIESESDVKYEAVDAGFVLGKMEDAQNQLNMVILDACRNNPYARYFRTASSGLARMDAPTGSLIVYSTAPGEVAADGPERNGVFTKHLIRHMQQPNLPIEQVLKRVRIDVATETKQRQIPWESSSLMGDFYFKYEKAALDNNQIGTERKDLAPSNPKTDSTYSAQPSNIFDPNASTNRKKLAILPFCFSNSPPKGMTNINVSQYDTTKRAAVLALKKLLINEQDLVPSYSYYELNEKYVYKKIDDHIFNKQIEAELWPKASIKPDIDMAILIGKRIGVDALFLGKINYDEMALYILNIDDRSIFSKEYSYHVSTGYTYASKAIMDFFINYRNFKME